jgi:hypothetical protein
VSKTVEKSFLDKETSLACLLGFHEKSQSEKALFYFNGMFYPSNILTENAFALK